MNCIKSKENTHLHGKICNKDVIIRLLQKLLLHPRVRLRISSLIHCQIRCSALVLRLSAVPTIHLASYWGGSEGGRGGLRCSLHGTAWPFEPGRAHCSVNRPCSTQKVRSVRLDHCACPAAWLLWSVLSVRGEVEQAGWLFAGAFFEKRTSKCCPLKLLCGEHHDIAIVCQRDMACRVGCFPFRWFQRACTEESC